MESSGPMMSSHLHSLTQSRMAVTHLIVVLLFDSVEWINGEIGIGVSAVVRHKEVLHGKPARVTGVREARHLCELTRTCM